MTEALANFSSVMWRSGNEGFVSIAAATDTRAVQLDCTPICLVQEAETRGVLVVGTMLDRLAAAELLPPARADVARTLDLARLCRLPKNQVMAAAAAGGAAPATTKAQIVVLNDNDPLACAIRGAGTTLTGQVLSPEAVRKLGCDASIIPIVLGSGGQPLDVGGTKRLVTPAMLAALWVRDKGCTFPGCGRPPKILRRTPRHSLGGRWTHLPTEPC